MIAAGIFRLVVQADFHGLPQEVDLGYRPHAVGGLHKGFVLGHALDGVLIGVLLVLQTAHETPAGARDLGGVEGEALGLGHLDGDGLKVVQEAAAAEGPPADPQSAQHLGLVPHTDLAQLDAGVEHAGQILHQGPEIHPALAGKEKEDLIAVKVVLHIHQLHVKPVVGDLLLADAEGPLLLFMVAPYGL